MENKTVFVALFTVSVSRSGEEGDYPDLVDFTEKKLMEVNPKRCERKI